MFAYGGKTPYDKEQEAKQLISKADDLRDEIKALQENDSKKTELREKRNEIITRLEKIQQHK